jgi:beta-lactamase regulating signal transducer with metallopeptidase domain
MSESVAIALDVSVKVAGLAAVAALLTARARPAAAAHAHRVWCLVLLSPLALLAGAAVITPAVIVLPDARLVAAAGGSALAGPAFGWLGRLPINPVVVAGLAYVVVAAALLLRLGAALLAVRRLVRDAVDVTPETDRDARAAVAAGTRLRAGALRVPVTVGVIAPVILLPADWRSLSAAEQAAVLRHESSHIRRGDYGWGVAAAAICALFWFHPAVWLAASRRRWFAELASDHTAARTLGVAAYASALASMAERWRTEGAIRYAVTVGAHSAVIRRLRLLADGPRPVRIGATTLALGLVSAGLLAAPSVRVALQPPPQPLSVLETKPHAPDHNQHRQRHSALHGSQH